MLLVCREIIRIVIMCEISGILYLLYVALDALGLFLGRFIVPGTIFLILIVLFEYKIL